MTTKEPGHVVRHGYVNTRSEAGKPSRVEFDPAWVTHANVWTNTFGNPTTMLYFKDGSELLLVDEHGACNDLPVSAAVVTRKRDL